MLGETTLLQMVDPTTNARGFPKTSESAPIFLFSKENNNVMANDSNDVPKFPVFQNVISVENDASLGKLACSIGHACKRQVNRIAMVSQKSAMNKWHFLVSCSVKVGTYRIYLVWWVCG